MADVLFTKVDYTIKKLLEDIDLGEIGLPDIQRPFVWSRSKVRDLLDSIYRGYPIGYFLFWQTWQHNAPATYRSIGIGAKQKTPRLLIVDGQQRLTSLYAVLKAKPVVNKDFQAERVRIAFQPLDERFEVTNSAIQNDSSWIPDISELWQSSQSEHRFITNFLKRLSAIRQLSDAEEQKIEESIARLRKIIDYPVSVLELSYSVDEEHVAEIFVRINSEGVPLNQANFILTLMSVFWDEGRKDLEDFCRRATVLTSKSASPYNPYWTPHPEQLLRVSVALGFRRARLEHVYSLLRGKDLQTKQFSVQQRDKQFSLLRQAQDYALDLQNWHDFFTALGLAGYLDRRFISSELAVAYTYALWLIGKRDFQLDPHRLREIIACWFFMASLTGRYSASPESRMEQDLGLLRELSQPEDFVRVLSREINAVLTADYWATTLPNQLRTASVRSTGQLAFYAALCVLNAPVLYSSMSVPQLISSGHQAKRSALERHHLFPKAYLNKIGIQDRALLNQVANYTLVEWADNAAISNRSPADYVPDLEARFSPEDLSTMYRLHALPKDWYRMRYEDFLAERQKLMAQVIREAFQHICRSICAPAPANALNASYDTPTP
jgi:hypothetical protein